MTYTEIKKQKAYKIKDLLILLGWNFIYIFFAFGCGSIVNVFETMESESGGYSNMKGVGMVVGDQSGRGPTFNP